MDDKFTTLYIYMFKPYANKGVDCNDFPSYLGYSGRVHPITAVPSP